MTPSAVIQVKPGIGDVIWHLPFIRAVAAASPGGKVTFLTPPSSRAKELLEADPSIAEIIYFEHGGSDLKRGLNQIRLIALLRRRRFQTLWIFDRTITTNRTHCRRFSICWNDALIVTADGGGGYSQLQPPAFANGALTTIWR